MTRKRTPRRTLKPCPFCGGKAKTFKRLDGYFVATCDNQVCKMNPYGLSVAGTKSSQPGTPAARREGGGNDQHI